MRSTSFSRSFLLYLIITSSISLLSATAYSVECGDTIGPGGHYALEKDLDCVESITVIGPVVFNLKGHTIDGSRNGPPYSAIIVEGRGARIHNGYMYGCTVTCILVGGSGHHSFSRLNIDEGYNGFIIESDYNKVYRNIVSRADWAFYASGKYNFLFKNRAVDNYGDGYVIGGRRNYLLYNTNKSSYWTGFVVSGNENRLIKNVSEGSQGNLGYHIYGSKNIFKFNKARLNKASGFKVNGEQQTLIANRSELNGKHGMEVGAVNSSFKRNTAIDNGDGATYFDLYEVNNVCDGNTWKKNYFYTANQDCIE